MAQRTENEETEFKVVPETITLCVKCGVAGNFAVAANNLCQKCFSGATAAASISSAAGTAVSKHLLREKSVRSSSLSLERVSTSTDLKTLAAAAAAVVVEDDDALPAVKRAVNRCTGCRRKVGLTGFRCRCGELFCADHRYSDRHDCSYDYKTAGREAIARENPVVKAAKIVKI